MAKQRLHISVVVPVYNEEESVSMLHGEITRVLQDLNMRYEIIFVDDGSTDKTCAAIKKLVPVRCISFARNFGKSQALQAGFDAARGEYIFTMDGDLQDDPREIPSFLQTLKKDGSDLVVGWKVNRQDTLFKRISSRCANCITSLLSGTRVHDMNCGYKLFRSHVAKRLRLYGDLHRYIPVLAANSGYTVTEMPVHHRKRAFGVSKYGTSGIKRLLKSFFDLITITLNQRFVDRPMHFFGMMGLASLFLGSAILLYLAWVRLVIGENIGDRPLLLLGTLLLLVGFQSFSLGFIADTIQNASEIRHFIVKEEVHNDHEGFS